jgi:hypothetical protein
LLDAAIVFIVPVQCNGSLAPRRASTPKSLATDKAQSLISEKEDGQWESVVMTDLTAGKWAAGFLLLSLSACAAQQRDAFPRSEGLHIEDSGSVLVVPTGRTALQLDEIFSTVNVGVAANDVAVLTPKNEGGSNANVEVQFATSDEFLSFLFSPKPHLGLAVNTAGATDQAYAGLTWSMDLISSVYGAMSLGLSVHDGKVGETGYYDKELGSRVLFRESVEVGVRLSDRTTLSVLFDHISNAGLAEVNEGLDTLGVRLGYQF